MQSAEPIQPRAPSESPWPGRAKRFAIVSLALSPFVLALAFRLPLCPSATLLGVPCPGCGLTRATAAALGGRFMDALALHPLVFLLTPLYVGFVGVAASTYIWGTERTRSDSWRVGKHIGLVMAIAMVLMVAVWVARFFGWFGGPVPIEPMRPL